MRRLIQHAAVGVCGVAVAVGAAVTGLGAPGSEAPLVAVPAPVVSQATAGTDAVAAERSARQLEADRSAAREQLTAAAISQASRRSAALTSQSRSIDEQRQKIAAERRAAKVAAAAEKAADEARARAEERAAAAEAAEEKAAAEAAEAARQEEVEVQGYESGTTDPREIARQILQNRYDYGDEQYDCFNNIIIRESNWDIDATNASSGAYGIPQALPGSKMASVADDWRTNPATQITWAIGYMKDRYGSPCEAWGFKRANGWY